MSKPTPLDCKQSGKKTLFPLLFTAWLLLFLPSILWAQSIALIPLLDLSKGPNGTNTVLTERLREELSARGRHLIPEDEVMHFLVRNRIRTLNGLSSYQIALVEKELKADLVLQGTVYQVEEEDSPLLSLTLQLSRTSNEKTIWSRTENLHHIDTIKLLGLNASNNLEKLYPLFFTRLFADMPETIESGEQALNRLKINNILIHPKNIRPTEEVTCKVRLHHPLHEDEKDPVLAVWANGKEHMLSLDAEGYYLTASWPAEEKGGSYPVTLIHKTSRGERQEEIIGTYNVDDTRPRIDMHLVAKEVDGQLAFSKKLKIIPLILEPEPFTHWEISIVDEGDEPVVYQTQGGTPPKYLSWHAATSIGSEALPGEYTIRLKVWDRVGYEATAEKTVLYLPELPEIIVDVTHDESRLSFDIENIMDTPLTYWWIKIIDENGRLLKLADGNELPTTVEMEFASEDEPQLQCILSARDVLGNQRQIQIANLFQQTEEEEAEEEINMETEWVEEF